MQQTGIDQPDRPGLPEDVVERATTPAERWLIAASGASLLLLLGLVFLFANILPSSGYPSPFSPLAKIDQFFSDNRSTIRWQSLVLMLAGVALLTFVGSLIGVLRRIVGDHILMWVALGGGVLASGFAMLSGIVLWTLSRTETSALPALLRALHDLTYLAGGPAHVLAVSVFLFASSIVMWNLRFFPPWVRWLGVIGAAVSSLGAIGLVWRPATYILVASRAVLMAWSLGVWLPLVSDRIGGIVRFKRTWT
jgi:hypothetical protein